ncbi:DUF4199 domain-containing protein [bacterium]|nr:DUF4199 domain-containing protein [bacterium]
MTEQQQPGKLIPALVGGGVMAILSTVPIISLGNCLCCLWILAGGALAAYMYSRELPGDVSISGGDGAVTGLLAGIFGALFASILGYLFMSMGDAEILNRVFENVLRDRSDLSPEVDELMRSLREGERLSPLYMVAGLFFSLIINAVFGTLGGLIGASMFKKKRPANQPGSAQ